MLRSWEQQQGPEFKEQMEESFHPNDPNFEKKIQDFFSKLEEDDEPDDSSSSELEDNLEVEADLESEEEESSSPVVNVPTHQASSHADKRRRTEIIKPPTIKKPTSASAVSLPAIIIPKKKSLKGKNNYKWSTTPAISAATRTPARNLVHFVQGPQGSATMAKTTLESFLLFVSYDMVQKILKHTNAEITKNAEKYGKKFASISPTQIDEIYSLLGLLVFSAVMKDGHLSTTEMFNSALCGSKYKATMSEQRFHFLLRSMRFDDKTTREERRQLDNFAPLREIWDDFVKNCQNHYKPGSYVTIDEQLLGFRGNCPFKMYMPKKPQKYGIKIVMCTDVKTKYMFNAEPYLGRKTDTGGLPLAEYFVKNLVKPIMGSNRNVTMDNWFFSVKLANDLLPPFNLTVIGTLRKNKREIPPELLNVSKSRPVGSSIFCFDRKLTMVSYKTKPNKAVLLISTAHDQPDVNHETKKPTIIDAYNSTKGGVDTLDQMCSTASCSRKTRRWPLSIFYGMINIAIVNSWVIYNHNSIRESRKILSRKQFMFQLSEELTKSWQQQRLGIPNLSKKLRTAIEENARIEPDSNQPSTSLPKSQTKSDSGRRTTCSFCPAKKRRMTTSYCLKCNQAYCGEHKGNVCNNCC